MGFILIELSLLQKFRFKLLKEKIAEKSLEQINA